MSRTKLFSRQAWDKNASIYEVIRTMPFNAQLASGTLSEARFKHYITQDAHYLIGFGRALTLAAAKAPNPDRIVQFAKVSGGRDRRRARAARLVFQAVRHHAAGLRRRHRSRRRVTITFRTCSPPPMPSPTKCCSARCCPASGSTPRWGATSTPAPRAANPYQAWIDTYAGEEFHAAVRAVIDATDEVAADVSPSAARADARCLHARDPARVGVLGLGLPLGDLAGLGRVSAARPKA